MEKPRIIIADTDLNYILPFQLKFAEDFFNKVEVEIITSAAYFEEFFSVHQQVDILIVSEELYSGEMQRHNISHVFVMTEQEGEDQTVDLNVNHIFKYDRGIKEIFTEILGKSGLPGMIDPGSQGTQVVLIYSAAGGVGKTTVAMGICGSLTKNHKRVLYLNAARLQSFQHMLAESAPITDPQVYKHLLTDKEDVYPLIKHVIREELFSYLPPFRSALISLGLEYSIYEAIIRSARDSGDYDFIIVDCDTVFDEEKAALLNTADRVVVLTTQYRSSVMATQELAKNINDIASNKYIFLCSNFEKDKTSSLVAPPTTLKFDVADYVEHFPHCERMTLEDLAKEASIQSAAFLII